MSFLCAVTRIWIWSKKQKYILWHCSVLQDVALQFSITEKRITAAVFPPHRLGIDVIQRHTAPFANSFYFENVAAYVSWTGAVPCWMMSYCVAAKIEQASFFFIRTYLWFPRCMVSLRMNNEVWLSVWIQLLTGFSRLFLMLMIGNAEPVLQLVGQTVSFLKHRIIAYVFFLKTVDL